jgi:hypothetical protein
MNDTLIRIGFKQLLYSFHGDSAGRLGRNARILAEPKVNLNAVSLNHAVVWIGTPAMETEPFEEDQASLDVQRR